MLTSTDRDLIMQWLDTAVAQLKTALHPEKIILFGSWARGTASRRSDVDLLIVWETLESPLDRIGTLLTLLRDAPRSIDVIVYTPTELSQRSNSHFIRQVLQEGVILYEQREPEL
jgi:uncharacterized protein